MILNILIKQIPNMVHYIPENNVNLTNNKQHEEAKLLCKVKQNKRMTDKLSVYFAMS